MKLTYIVGGKDQNRTVHSVMQKELKISATLMRRLKLANAVFVCGETVFTNHKLSSGDFVEIDISLAEPPCDNVPEQCELEVLYENEGLLAINKPPGILVHPSRSRYTGTLSNFVAGYLQKASRGGNPLAWACHAVNRLDRDTSGVVLFAKNTYMKSLASQALSGEKPVKEYLALVSGKMPESGTIDVPIRRFEERNMLRIPSRDGQRAVTHFETIRVMAAGECGISLVKFRLETGRTHQIRVHCLHLGCPILGDKLYNDGDSLKISQTLGVQTQALHALRLVFTDPLTKKQTEITAPWNPPVDAEKYPCNLPLDMLTY